MTDFFQNQNLNLFGSPETSASIAKLKAKYDCELPDDYLQILAEHGIFNVYGEYESITLFSISDILSGELHDLAENLGPIIPIGSDGGGDYYFYDIDGKSNQGVMAIGKVDPGSPRWEYVISCGETLTAALNLIVSDASFEEHDEF